MTANTTISALKANRLFWLGRYQERVYMTLHLLRQCYDKMIDGDKSDYEQFWSKLDSGNNYATPDEFKLGMLYDETNPQSLVSELNFAKDNAILLREDIMSETLSYIEMSIAHINKCKAVSESNITHLQSITDWTLAFWGSVFQRISNPRIIDLIAIGRNVEHIDMLIRFGYPYDRVRVAYNDIKHHSQSVKRILDPVIEAQLDELITRYLYENRDFDYTNKVLKYINQLILV